jgi:hypothetical protein
MEELQKQLEELKNQLAGLLTENSEFRQKEIARQKTLFDQLYNAIILVVEEGDLLQYKFDSTYDEVKANKVMIKLDEVNNPSSSFLGFNFLDVINKACEDHLLSGLPDDQKISFRELVSRVINNPIVSVILNSNPVTKIISGVIDRVDTFMETKVAKEGKDFVTKAKHIIQERKVVNFYNSLKKYIDFYDSLLNAANQYGIAVDNLSIKHQGIQNEYSGYYTKFIETLGLSKNQKILPQINKMFQIVEVNGVPNYAEIIENEKIRAAYDLASKFYIFQQTVDLVRADYDAVLIKYLDANVFALETSKGFSDDSINKGETMKVITEIETLKKRLQLRKTN